MSGLEGRVRGSGRSTSTSSGVEVGGLDEGRVRGSGRSTSTTLVQVGDLGEGRVRGSGKSTSTFVHFVLFI